ncbi:matrixin family metalloprotease [Melioribacteraceae bacterium 4301-Me]|uniref:matrixin family metalloprotease n=1 Tax=Pyranulibacter aquaticus TaxID=3163344 RepID=UPI0035991A0F
MKTSFVILFLSLFLFVSNYRAQCPEPYPTWYRTITTSTYKWYWDRNLNGAQFRGYNYSDIDPEEAKQWVVSAINAAVNAWKSAVNAKGIVISDMSETTNYSEASFRITFEPMSGYLGNTPNPHELKINSTEIWTPYASVAQADQARDIYTVVLHEMGHIFMGPGHSYDSTSIMVAGAGNDNVPVRRSLNTCDQKIVRSFYNPLWDMIIDNNFTDNSGNNTHGQIIAKIGNGNNVTYTAPRILNNVPDGNLTLTAVSPQIDNQGYQRIWYNGTYAEQSRWTWRGVIKSYDQSYSHEVTYHDDGTTYMANLTQYRATTSGTLSEDETWWANVTLTGNVTVPSGITLTVTSDVTVNFNGYGILLDGGSVNFQGGDPNCVYLKQSGSLKGYFGTIQSAINYASSNQTIELQPRTYNENPSLSSKSNITLTGQGQGSTTLNGSISVTNSSYITVSNLTMGGGITLNNSTWTDFTNATITGSRIATNYGGSMNEICFVSASNIGASFGLTA